MRAVPDNASQPVLEFPTVASSLDGTWGRAWQERTMNQDALPKTGSRGGVLVDTMRVQDRVSRHQRSRRRTSSRA